MPALVSGSGQQGSLSHHFPSPALGMYLLA